MAQRARLSAAEIASSWGSAYTCKRLIALMAQSACCAVADGSGLVGRLVHCKGLIEQIMLEWGGAHRTEGPDGAEDGPAREALIAQRGLLAQMTGPRAQRGLMAQRMARAGKKAGLRRRRAERGAHPTVGR